MYPKPQLFMTGATGLIGTHLMAELNGRFKVTAYTRNVAAAESLLGSHINYISRFSALDNLDRFDAVINLAGEPIADKRWTDEQKAKIEESRWHTTSELVRLIQASAKPPSVFISGSAIGYYGRQGEQVIEEDFAQVYPEFSHHLCKKWEDIALQAQSDSTRVCLLRTGVVLSRHGGALDKMLLPFKLGLGGPVAEGNQYLSWIHVDDMVAAIMFLLDSQDCQGAFNLTAPSPVTSTEFAKSLANQLRRPAFLRTPEFVLRALMGEGADLLVHGQRVVPARLEQAGFNFRYPQIDKALCALDL